MTLISPHRMETLDRVSYLTTALLAVLTITHMMTLCQVDATHFRGGSISWSPVDGRKVRFHFMMAWEYGKGPGCTASKVGQFVSKPMASRRQQYVEWICQKGCPTKTPVGPKGYVCMDSSVDDNWEQGEATFLHTFTDSGPFHFGYSGTSWKLLNFRPGGGGGRWNIFTTVDLRTRNDTGKINSSPTCLIRPLYNTQHDCTHEIPITVIDNDGDNVRCRWAVGQECESVCHGLPGAQLDEEKCTITFEATSKMHVQPNTMYAVALTIEDFPKSTISLGSPGDKRTPSDSLSSVPLQFLIKTPQYPGPCSGIPRFVLGTPSKNKELFVEEGKAFSVNLFADNGHVTSVKVESIQATGVPSMTQSALTPDSSRTNTFGTTLTWMPQAEDVGRYIVCCQVENEKKISGIPRCFTVNVVPRSCQSRSCENGGKCIVDQSGNSTCSCPSGYMGAYCQIDIDDCTPNPCHNGLSCIDGVNSFTCACSPGYTGVNCHIDIDDCTPNPCHNGASCIDGVNSFTCTCLPGYTGVNCQIDIDDCTPNPCHNGASCIDGVNSFTCTCLPGYTGVNCQTDIDDCTPNPCHNGASCIDGINSCTCTCLPGYTGVNCQTDIDDCTPNPCHNGASCIDGVNSFTCACLPGYTSVNCQIDIDDCTPNPCHNGANCIDGVNSFTCTCLPGYTGVICQTDIDDCTPNPCHNGASCIDGVNSFTCTCLPGYTGVNCQTDIDDCTPNPCHNRASCIDGINSFTCACLCGYTGANCQTDINDCTPNPCHNGASCIDGINSFTCTCLPGYTGVNCHIDIDDCTPNPCHNGASCIDGVNSFTCACLPGYTGVNCQIDIDDCTPNPCHNGASCIDGVNSFTCTCLPGYTGVNCHIDIDDCTPDPCHNGASCIDGVNSFTCVCLPGYTDVNCQTDIDECTPNPCHNGASCIDDVNSFTCTCLPGYTGINCQTEKSTTTTTTNPSISSTVHGTEYDHCRCVVLDNKGSSSGKGSTAKHAMAGIIGFPVGFGLSLATFFMVRYSKGKCCMTSRGRSQSQVRPTEKESKAVEPSPSTTHIHMVKHNKGAGRYTSREMIEQDNHPHNGQNHDTGQTIDITTTAFPDS